MKVVVDTNNIIVEHSIRHESRYIDGRFEIVEEYTDPKYVWDFVRTITNMSICDREESFGISTPYEVLAYYSYNDAKERYDKWKKEKEGICVFDEVTTVGGVRCLVTQKVGSICNYITSEGACGRIGEACLTKTGRRFTDLKEFMEDK